MTMDKILNMLSPENANDTNVISNEILKTLKNIEAALAPGMDETDAEAEENNDPVQNEINNN